MSIISDVEYWNNRNWDGLSPQNQRIAKEFESCRRTYVAGIKAGLLSEDDPKFGFKFDPRKATRSMFSVSEIETAAGLLNVPEETITLLISLLRELTEKEGGGVNYYLKYR